MSLLAVVKIKKSVTPSSGTAVTRAIKAIRVASLIWNSLVFMSGCAGSGRPEQRHGFEIDQRVDVEDEANPAVTQNCRTRQRVALLESLAEGLNDNLLFADQAVHQNAT